MAETSYSDFVADDQVIVSHDYTNFEQMAEGAYCDLWRACKEGQWYVVKALKPQFRKAAQYESLLRKEYDILSMFDSAYVVKVYGFPNLPDYGNCIVMEWVDGVTLKQWLHGDRGDGHVPNCHERKRIALQLVDALTYVHSLQVVHRDLKPSNIMITRNGGQVKLIDFGLADTDSYTILKQPAGTKGYVSPEQMQNSHTDERNDIYSLGVILHEMRLGWQWQGVVAKALKPHDKRLDHVADIPTMVRGRQKWMRWVIITMLTLVMVLCGFAGYDHVFNPRPHYDVVARFRYGNMMYESWGNGLVTIRMTSHVDSVVQIPDNVTYNNFRYRVDEVTFDAFRNDKELRSVIIPPRVHVMKGAFKGCDQLRDIYINGAPPLVGNELWPTEIDHAFDAPHFSKVKIHVPKQCRKCYATSPWKRFEHYVYY
mgnify:FL=1